MKPSRTEWAGWWALGAFVLGVTMAICTAEPGDGLRYVILEFLITTLGS